MKLESFKEKNTKRKAIIVGSVFVVLLISVVVLIRSFALYETKQEYNVIKGTVGNYSPSDITITSYIDGSPSKTFPTKDSEYAVDKVECNNGARGLWSYTNWEVNLSNLTTTGTKCKVYFVKSYKENILNGTDPIVSENLIPVTISNDGTVKKADMTKEWYKYENKTWANAIILEDESKVYQNGEVIPENNIESYFVWIPRYKYKIFNEGKYSETTNYENKVQQIEVVFENKNTAVSNGSNVGSYLTHPAFTSFNSNGLWVGKFETGYKGATTMIEAEKNVNDTNKVQIKPNVYSWRNIQVANAHLNSYHYQRSLDSHMMKNIEWGAVAFFQHSKYGSMQSVRQNNNSASITGYGAVNEPKLGMTLYKDYEETSLGVNGTLTKVYNTDIGYLASTTGNISGIYDMSGGTNDAMMTFIKYNNKTIIGQNSTRNAGFNGVLGCPNCTDDTSGIQEVTDKINLPSSQYYDLYDFEAETNVLSNNYMYRMIGDATGETGPFGKNALISNRAMSSWYNDHAVFINRSSPFFLRGGSFDHGIDSGIFNFDYFIGEARTFATFRVVLTF